MRKGLRKLSLSRETLRALERHTLDTVQAGAPGKTQICPTPTNPYLDCTYSCPEVCPISGTICA
jgi:hypothetical protein